MSEQQDIRTFMEGLREALDKGHVREAREQLSAAFPMLENQLGKYHPTIIQCLCMMGNFEYALESAHSALECYIEARTRAGAALYESHPLYYEIFWGMARVYEYQSLNREASHFYFQAAELRASVQLPDAEKAVNLFIHAGRALEKENCFAEAQDIYRHSIEYLESMNGSAALEDHTLVYMALGRSLLERGDAEAAVQVLEQALTSPIEVMSWDRLHSLQLLGDAHSMIENYPAALEAWHDCYSFLEPAHPDQQDFWLQTGTRIADTLFRVGRELESLDHLRGMLEIAVELDGSPTDVLVPLHQRTAEGYFHLQMYQAAREHLSTACRLEEMRSPVVESEIARILYGLGLIGLKEGNTADAVTNFRESKSRLEKCEHRRSDLLAKIHHSLGWAFHFDQKQKEAESHYLKSLQIQREEVGEVFLDTEELLERVQRAESPLFEEKHTASRQDVSAHDSDEPVVNAAQQVESARQDTKIYESSKAISKQFKTPPAAPSEPSKSELDESPRLDQLFHSATLAVDQRKFAEAARILSEILALLERKEGEFHPDLIPVLDLLALVNTNLGQHTEANELRARAGSIQALQQGMRT